MSTITREFTKEQLTKIIDAANEVITALAGENEDLSTSNNLGMVRAWDYLNDDAAPPEVVKRLAEIALASLEADGDSEPVAFINGAWTLVYYRPPKELGLKIGDKLYTAPPATVSVPAAYEHTEDFREYHEGWNACRAAMLQGAEPVTTDYKLPANTPCKEAPEHIWLQTAGVWPENGEFSELTWCSDNQHPDDTLYVRADVVAGNSPVIPGEVLSAVRKVACIRADFDGFDGDRRGIGDCLDEAEQELIVTINKHSSVIAAAPQQEVR